MQRTTAAAVLTST